MIAIRTVFTALALAAAGIAQAGEITEFPVERSVAARAEVQAQARNAPRTNELYDGSQAMDAPRAAKSRDEVRAEAAMARGAKLAAASAMLVGGM